jgi:hypothetical protein
MHIPTYIDVLPPRKNVMIALNSKSSQWTPAGNQIQIQPRQSSLSECRSTGIFRT